MSAQSYDDIPYESNALKQTHPKHLYQLAAMHGLHPVPLEKAYVLELGCASGGNIIPMAFHYPQTRFVGLDLSPIQIANGNQVIKHVKLENISLECLSILDFNDTKKFDYIICHGMYSWVDTPIRNKILQICHDNLSAHGIAYISYNTYPGWVMGNTLRDLMLFSTKNSLSLEDKMHNIQNLFTLFFNEQHSIQTDYDWLLNEEMKIVSQHSMNQLAHEHLSLHHTPLYFYQFVEQAKSAQLDYVADATFFELSIDTKEQQNIDFIHNRRFRSSLLSHQGLPLTKIAEQQVIQNYYLQYLALSDNNAATLSDKPLADEFVRYQAQFQLHVTNSLHENILLSDIALTLMPYLDGKHDIPFLNHVIMTMINEGELALVDRNQQPIIDDIEIQRQTQKICLDTLGLLARRSLLIAG